MRLIRCRSASSPSSSKRCPSSLARLFATGSLPVRLGRAADGHSQSRRPNAGHRAQRPGRPLQLGGRLAAVLPMRSVGLCGYHRWPGSWGQNSASRVRACRAIGAETYCRRRRGSAARGRGRQCLQRGRDQASQRAERVSPFQDGADRRVQRRARARDRASHRREPVLGDGAVCERIVAVRVMGCGASALGPSEGRSDRRRRRGPPDRRGDRASRRRAYRRHRSRPRRSHQRSPTSPRAPVGTRCSRSTHPADHAGFVALISAWQLRRSGSPAGCLWCNGLN